VSNATNPYQPPESEILPESGTRDAWFDGDILVVRKGGRLPTHSCLRCGAPSTRTSRRKLSWYPPFTFLAFVLLPVIGLWAFAIFVVVGLILTRSGRLEFGYCGRCRTRQRVLVTSGLAILFGGAAWAASMIEQGGNETLAFWVFGLSFAGALITIWGRRPLSIQRITSDQMRFRRVPKSVLTPGE